MQARYRDAYFIVRQMAGSYTRNEVAQTAL
jgi:hypothetical protein